MQTVKVKKQELLKALQENKAKHNELFQAAVDGYWKAAQIELLKLQKDLDAKKPISTQLDLEYPANFSDSYDSAIDMVKMSVDEFIELSKAEFNQYVRNKWEFVQRFNVVNSKYCGSAL